MTAQIAEIIRNGVYFDVKNWAGLMTQGDSLLASIDALFSLLVDRNINYVLVGGIALLSYVEGRNTQDIDLILDRCDLEQFTELEIQEENQNFLRGHWGSLQIDILLTQNDLFKAVRENFCTERSFGSQLVRCVTVEGLILLKCYALPSLYRQGQFNRASIYENDVLLLLLNYSVDLKPLLTLLSSHLLDSDLKEIREILAEIQQRIKRLRRSL
ncbi:MAG: hypothetical protein ACO3EZ_07610 [Prochlorotrichaceae cyanobacterium]|jgi:hypothetical protein